MFCKTAISLYNEIIFYVIIYYCLCHDNALDNLNYFSIYFWKCFNFSEYVNILNHSEIEYKTIDNIFDHPYCGFHDLVFEQIKI
jgi:hypothetical protein